MKKRVFLALLAVALVDRASAVPLTALQSDSRRDTQVYYRFGKIGVESATVFTPEQIMRIAGIKSNVFASPSVINQAESLIKRAYLNRGHVRVETTVEADYQLISPRTKQGLVEVRIKIDEGPVFRTRRLEFEGNQTTQDRIIRRRVLLNEGDPYTDELLDKSLQRINGLGRFEKVTRQNVTIEIDDWEQIVDVRIRLRERIR